MGVIKPSIKDEVMLEKMDEIRMFEDDGLINFGADQRLNFLLKKDGPESLFRSSLE